MRQSGIAGTSHPRAQSVGETGVVGVPVTPEVAPGVHQSGVAGCGPISDTSHPRAQKMGKSSAPSMQETSEAALGVRQGGEKGCGPGSTHPRIRSLRKASVDSVPVEPVGEASVRRSVGSQGEPQPRRVQIPKPVGRDEYVGEEAPILQTKEEMRLSRIGKAELPDEEQGWACMATSGQQSMAGGGASYPGK